MSGITAKSIYDIDDEELDRMSYGWDMFGVPSHSFRCASHRMEPTSGMNLYDMDDIPPSEVEKVTKEEEWVDL